MIPTATPRGLRAYTCAAAMLAMLGSVVAVPVGARAGTTVASAVRASAGATVKVPVVVPRSKRVFGHSVRGRRLVVHVVGDPKASQRVLVVGAIHGNELGGRAIVRRLERATPPLGTVYYLVEDLNPDGAARHTRQNARGVDLNRNFPKRWSGASSKGSPFWSGPRPSSERETRAMERLVKQVRPTLTVWYHQHMRLVDLNVGSRTTARAYARTARLRLTTLAHQRGSVATWQRAHWPHATVLVVELPAHMTPARRARHVAAVRASATPEVRPA